MGDSPLGKGNGLQLIFQVLHPTTHFTIYYSFIYSFIAQANQAAVLLRSQA
jgi:hypothetical protein